MRSHFIPALVYLTAAFFVVWSPMLSFGESIPGAEGTDSWNALWELNHWAVALGEGQLPWLTQAINYPEGGRVMVSDPLGATIVSPVVWFFGPSVGMTVLTWLHIAFSGWATHRFAAEFLVWRRGTGSVGWGPWVSGMAMLSAPVLVSHIHNGSTEGLSAGWTVLAIWMAWRSASEPSPKRLLLASLALPLAALAHWYGGVVALVFMAAIVFYGVGSPGSPLSVGRWVPLLAGSLLCGALALSVLPIHRASDSVSPPPTMEEASELRRTIGGADPLTYLVPGEHRSPDFRRLSTDDHRFVHGHYLGWVLIGLGCWALVRRSRHTGFLVVGGLGCVALSLGPVLIHDALPVLLAGNLAVPLPYFLIESFAGFRELALPWKLAVGPAIMLAMLAGVAVDQRGNRVALLSTFLVVLEVNWLSPTSELARSVGTKPEASLLALADAPPGAVINYPLRAGRPYMFEQTVHSKPVAGSLHHVANEHAMRLWGRILIESQSDPDTFHRAVSSTAERLGIRYLVIHTDPEAEPDVYSKAVVELERLFDVPEWGQGQARVVPLW